MPLEHIKNIPEDNAIEILNSIELHTYSPNDAKNVAENVLLSYLDAILDRFDSGIRTSSLTAKDVANAYRAAKKRCRW